MTNDEIEIDLKGILIELWRKLPLIILVGVITATLGFSYASFYLTPTYQSTTKMYVLSNLNQSGSATYMNDLQIGASIVKDCPGLIKSRYVGEQVIENLGLNMSATQVLSEISIGTSDDSRIMTITVTDTDPKRAMEICDEVREVAAQHIQNVMGVEAVNTIDVANLPMYRNGPNVVKYTMMGALAGIFVMSAIFVLRFVLNDTIRVPEDIETKLGMSVLAVVPTNSNKKGNKAKKRA